VQNTLERGGRDRERDREREREGEGEEGGGGGKGGRLTDVSPRCDMNSL
jgi:hypothetical protein